MFEVKKKNPKNCLGFYVHTFTGVANLMGVFCWLVEEPNSSSVATACVSAVTISSCVLPSAFACVCVCVCACA